jgi:aspartate racemase
MSKTIGIIGGMGPFATVDLMNKIIRQTPASHDQDHIHMIVDNYPQIPDRTLAIYGGGVDPTPFLTLSAKRLQHAGADFIIIACNTAHYFSPTVEKLIDIPILHMPHETVHFIRKMNITEVGLLATDGTIKTKIYQDALEGRGITVTVPDTHTEMQVMDGIYAVKSGDLQKGIHCLTEAAESLSKSGVKVIIAGCTEISLVLLSTGTFQIIDPSEILAKNVVKLALA